MSTTGNENGQPGVNRPEGENAGEPPQQREVENPEQGAAVPGAGAAEEGWSGSFPPPSDARASDGVAGAGSAGAGSAADASHPDPEVGEPARVPGEETAAATGNPSSGEPSHEAVGVGVIDDGTTSRQPAAAATAPSAGGGTPGGQSQSGQDAPTSGSQAAGAHHGQDLGRDTMTAGQAQREGALGTAQEQNLPAMAQNNASDIEKISGIVVQTRDDLAATQPERVYDVLKQRFEQSGIDLPDNEIQELARQITTGDA